MEEDELYMKKCSWLHMQTAESTEMCRRMTREGFLEGNILFMCQL